jgi:hypothetical protein
VSEVKLTARQVERVREIQRAVQELNSRLSAMLAMVWPHDSEPRFDLRDDGVYLVDAAPETKEP